MPKLALAVLACATYTGQPLRLQASKRQRLLRFEDLNFHSQPLTEVHLPRIEDCAAICAPNKIRLLRLLALLLLTGKRATAFLSAGPEARLPLDGLFCSCRPANSRLSRILRVPAAPRARDSPELPTVVVGGGIVGLTTAYYLTQQGQPVTIVEQCAIGCHVSGKATGLLAHSSSYWHSGFLRPLADQGYALHAELAQELGAEEIGYRRARVLGPSWEGQASDAKPDWLADGFLQDMGSESYVSHVTPHKLMQRLLAKVTSQGADVVIGKAVGVKIQDKAADSQARLGFLAEVAGKEGLERLAKLEQEEAQKGDTVSAVIVEIDGKQELIPCSSLVLAMGPWAKDAAQWFPKSVLPKRTAGLRYASLVWDETFAGKYSLMIHTLGAKKLEIYPRSDELYACGCPTVAPLPDDPQDITPSSEEIDTIKSEAASIVERLSSHKVIRSEAWYEATSDDGTPVVGSLQKISNVVISCGGGRFGFQFGPAMGQNAANIVMGIAPVINLLPFDPARFDLETICKAQEVGVPAKLLGLAARYPQIISLVKVDKDGEALYKLDQLHTILQQDPSIQDKLERMLKAR